MGAATDSIAAEVGAVGVGAAGVVCRAVTTCQGQGGDYVPRAARCSQRAEVTRRREARRRQFRSISCRSEVRGGVGS
jgi:hypothetical protein